MAKDKIKLYTHHFTYVEETIETVRPSGAGFLLALPFRAVASVCYAFGIFLARSVVLIFSIFGKLFYLVGLSLIYPFTFMRGQRGETGVVERQIVQATTTLEDRLRKLTSPQLGYTLVVFLVLCATVVGSFNAATLYTKGQGLKARVLGQATSAIDALQHGKDLLGRQETAAAVEAFDKAIFEFSASRESLEQAGSALRIALSVVPATHDAEKLLEAGTLLTGSAQKLVGVYERVKQITISDMGLASPNGLAVDFENIRLDIDSALADVSSAQKKLQDVNSSLIPEDKRNMFVEARELVGRAQQSLGVVSGLVTMGVTALSGDKHVVVFFQNNNELRSSGGFPGSFADFTLRNGKIENLRVTSIYDLDGQLKDRIIAPTPLFAVTDRLFLRDSNWFVNFPESAGLMAELYQKTSGKRADIILAVTPNLVIDILKITGPIHMPEYGVVLDSDNFIEQTQKETSLEYDKLENKPKKMLSDLLPQLWQRISELPRDNMVLVLSAVQKNLAQGNILFYARDPELQEQFASFGWTGEVRPTDRDFLYISKSNLGGTKTDTYIGQATHLTSDIAADGGIINTLRVTYTNPLPPIDATTNTAFLRVLVPEGSRLVSSTGFSPSPLPTDFKPEGRMHVRVSPWERNAAVDTSTGTIVGREAGKTFFGNWMVLKGGETKTFEITYRLPFTLQSLDHMSLLVQKQPGSKEASFTYTVKFPGRTVHWKNFIPTDNSHNELTLEMVVDENQFYGLVLEQAE